MLALHDFITYLGYKSLKESLTPFSFIQGLISIPKSKIVGMGEKY